MQHADAVVLRLEDSEGCVRWTALQTLSKLEPTALAQRADAVVLRLDDSDEEVRSAALLVLGSMEPAALAKHANAVLAKLGDTEMLAEETRSNALEIPWLDSASVRDSVRDVAVLTLQNLPDFVTRGVDFEAENDFQAANLRSRLLGRLGWYRCRLRMRVRRLALYWYALPYRPSGPGHARDVEAWDRMSKRSRLV